MNNGEEILRWTEDRTDQWTWSVVSPRTINILQLGSLLKQWLLPLPHKKKKITFPVSPMDHVWALWPSKTNPAGSGLLRCNLWLIPYITGKIWAFNFSCQRCSIFACSNIQHQRILCSLSTQPCFFGITYEATSSALMLKLANKGSDDEYSQAALTFPLSLHRTILVEGFWGLFS